MGTDIEIFAEYQNADRTWSLAEPPVSREDGNGNGYEFPSCYNGRCYALFAILANVRNGIRIEGEYKSIADNRGVPEDMSQLAKLQYGGGEGWHDATWMFVEEIYEFDWEQMVQCVGCVEQDIAHLFEANPIGWPTDQIKKIRGEKQVQAGAAVSMRDGLVVRWRETYANSANFKCLDRDISKYRRQGQPETSRLIMWFGS